MPPKRRIAKLSRRFDPNPDHVRHLIKGWSWSWSGVSDETSPLAWELWGGAMTAAWEGGPVPSFDAIRDPGLRDAAVRQLEYALAKEDRSLRLWGWWRFESGVPLPRCRPPELYGADDRFKDCTSLESEVTALIALGQFTEADQDRLRALGWTSPLPGKRVRRPMGRVRRDGDAEFVSEPWKG